MEGGLGWLKSELSRSCNSGRQEGEFMMAGVDIEKTDRNNIDKRRVDRGSYQRKGGIAVKATNKEGNLDG